MILTSDAPARDDPNDPDGDASGGDGAAVAPRPPTSLLATLAVGATLAAGVFFRFATTSDLWLDEALSVNIAVLPLSDLEPALRHDGAPPLYYLLLHFWTVLFGASDLAVRSLSGVIGVAAVVAAWFAGRRLGGKPVAWAAVLVMALNPYAVRYSTETRMYVLEVLLVFGGILAVRRALERPTLDRLAVFAVLVALLVYTQYWAFYLLLVVLAFFFVSAWRGPHRVAARRLVVALVVGAATFVAWVPTFLYQLRHTGTPWGEPVLPGVPIGQTLSDFAGSTEQEGWLLLFPTIALLLLGVFGRAVDGRRIEIDLRTRPDARWEALIGGATLVVANSLNYLTGGAFQSRYSAIIAPFYVLVVARGVTTFSSPRVRAGVLAVVVALSAVGAGRNFAQNRTQAGQVAAVIDADARPGDLVLYCPDQLGPAVNRLLDTEGLDEVTYPAFRRPEFVDWVDYEERVARHDPVPVAERALERAGDATIWLVHAPGYRTHVAVCEALADALGEARVRTERVVPDEKIFEKPGLVQFSPP